MKKMQKIAILVILLSGFGFGWYITGGSSELFTGGSHFMKLSANTNVEIQLLIPHSNKVYILSKAEATEVLRCITNRKNIKSETPPALDGLNKLPALSIRVVTSDSSEGQTISLVSTPKGYLVKDGQANGFLRIDHLDQVFNRILSIHS